MAGRGERERTQVGADPDDGTQVDAKAVPVPADGGSGDLLDVPTLGGADDTDSLRPQERTDPVPVYDALLSRGDSVPGNTVRADAPLGALGGAVPELGREEVTNLDARVLIGLPIERDPSAPPLDADGYSFERLQGTPPPAPPFAFSSPEPAPDLLPADHDPFAPPPPPERAPRFRIGSFLDRLGVPASAEKAPARAPSGRFHVHVLPRETPRVRDLWREYVLAAAFLGLAFAAALMFDAGGVRRLVAPKPKPAAPPAAPAEPLPRFEEVHQVRPPPPTPEMLGTRAAMVAAEAEVVALRQPESPARVSPPPSPPAEGHGPNGPEGMEAPPDTKGPPPKGTSTNSADPPPPAAEAAEPAGGRMLSILSQPMGALVEVDGKPLGRTPLIQKAPTGARELAVTLSLLDHEPHKERLRPNAEGHFSLNVKLVKR